MVTGSFTNDPDKNYLKDDTLYVSRIFKWYNKALEGDVICFFIKYARGDFKSTPEAGKDELDVEYLDYDWSLIGK